MSNVFEHYEADYLSSTRTAAQNIEKLPDLLPGHEKAELTAATDRAIDAAEDIVKQMELEARSLQGEERQTAVAQAKDYKASIAALKERHAALEYISATPADLEPLAKCDLEEVRGKNEGTMFKIFNIRFVHVIDQRHQNYAN